MSQRQEVRGDPPRWGRRPVLLVVGCVLVGLAVAAGLFLVAPKTYQASATLVVLPTSTGLEPGGVGNTEISMETEAELARSEIVASAATTALDDELTSAELLGNGSVTVPPNSQVLELTVQAPTAELASAAANAWAEAYLARRAEQASALVDTRTARLQAALDEQRERQATLDPQDPEDQATLEVVVNNISEIQKQLLQLGVSDTEVGQVITEAAPPSRPVKPLLPLYLGAGLVAGAALGLGLLRLAAMRRRGEQPLPAPTHEVEVPVLASIAGPPLSASEEETLREVCRHVASAGVAPGPLALVGGGDAKTATAVGLELTKAWATEFGDGVIVTTDAGAVTALPKAAQARPGLSDLLANSAAPGECVTHLEGSPALLIGPGSRSEIAASLNPGRVLDLWGLLGRTFGTVLISSAQHEGRLATMAIRTSGPIIGVVPGGPDNDDQLQALFDAIEGASSEDRLVGVIVVGEGDGDGKPGKSDKPQKPQQEDDPRPLSRAGKPATSKRGTEPTKIVIAPTVRSPVTGERRDT